MVRVQQFKHLKHFLPVLIGLVICIISTVPVHAQSTQQGDVTVTATVYGAPPTIPAVILSPIDGSIVEATPLVVRGSCGPNLLVRVFNNTVLAGSIVCSPDGTFTVNITLSTESNVLSALNYDFQDQPGPASTAVTVTVSPPAVTYSPSPVIIENERVQADEVTSQTDNTVGTTSDGNTTEVPLFAGTFIEPITKLQDVEVGVSPAVKKAFTIAITVLFLSIVLPAFVGTVIFILIKFL